MQTVGMRQLVNPGGNTLPIHFYVRPTMRPRACVVRLNDVGLTAWRSAANGAGSLFIACCLAPFVGCIAVLS